MNGFRSRHIYMSIIKKYQEKFKVPNFRKPQCDKKRGSHVSITMPLGTFCAFFFLTMTILLGLILIIGPVTCSFTVSRQMNVIDSFLYTNKSLTILAIVIIIKHRPVVVNKGDKE